MDKEFRLWVGRSEVKSSEIMIEMGESISIDKKLYREDIRASLAHARMLFKINILTENELNQIEKNLNIIQKEIEEDKFIFEAKFEDIHTHIEKRLIELCGEVGKKLHTGRSRNDQIAVDTHIYIINHSRILASQILELCELLISKATNEIDTLLPGYTHLQTAQPIRLSHHLLCYFWSFIRDIEKLANVALSASTLPLGSGALAGVNYNTDREFLKNDLGFNKIYANSMDAVSNRDYIIDFCYSIALCITHCSRMAEEIILWNTQEFSFIILPDELTTGSSIMPQKKNPDLAELIRGKTGRIQSNLHNLLINLKAQPMTYNRDLQEDKFPMFDSSKQISICLTALTLMIRDVKYNRKKMRKSLENGFATATDLADALVMEKKLSFRDAHHLVGKLVAHSVSNNKNFIELDKSERSNISEFFSDDDFFNNAIDIEKSVEKKKSYGSTSKHFQFIQIEEAKKTLEKWKKYNWQIIT